MSNPLGTVCLECFKLIRCEGGTRVRCSVFKFKERLPLTPEPHPFISLPRNCKEFNDKEEDDAEEGNS